MSETQGHVCPECGAPRGVDNTPSCACTERASEALRDARTAEAAAAGDFNPLRIRPYVELDPSAGDGDGRPQGPEPEVPAAESTMPLRPVGPEAADADATSVLPTPLSPPQTPPSATDLRLFEAGSGCSAPGFPDGGGRPRRRGRTVLLGAGGTVVTVIAAAGFASGMFSYDTPSRDRALPEDVRVSVPEPSRNTTSASPSTDVTSTAPTSASPSPSDSASPSPSSASPSASSASPSASRSASPTPTQPSATATGEDSDDDNRRSGGAVLQRGDKGPEVVELQLRLRQLNLYTRDASGNYNEPTEDAVSTYQWSRGIRSDELGVYGQETRARLESETTEP
ncbi:peptidoglycan-binding protein [Streptomyces sp. HUCO-GS316]|uniref:peptidoglycan-binding protein n=1 Tax=Streptomyces sp. HUCO-GS316 TaxID=2692198 RepID=UPI001370F483|nr:peptidoglycan-binding protein [Streptomyces sp. HUCO-GS316]MXM62699.1 peptidoglycan-binding protein [Streptomyces sp. HUCO-GS316]